MFESLLRDNKLADIEFGDQKKYRSIPGLALPAICLLDEYLTKDMKVFEWGSGASTIFFAQRCNFVVSVEHNKDWFKKVSKALKYRVVDDSIGWIRYDAPGTGYNVDFASYQPGYETVNFEDYVRDIESFLDERFDVILVDGRARNACLKAAQPKLRPGGLLILDDSARPIYQYAMAEIDWPMRHFEGCIPYYRHGHTIRTTIWVKE